MDIQAYAAQSAGAALTPFAYEAADLGAFGAHITISHCGVCHSDLHLVDGDWGRMSKYPLVPGHEIIGTVVAVGNAADQNLVGKRVGVGWQRSACLSCEWCLSGQEELCDQHEAICVGHYGGFAESIIVDSRFTHLIPDEISSDNAAPLLCAGVTVYSPLRRYANHTSRVGVMGIGGLGHLALQFANKMGCEVTAFSSSATKQDEAQTLGAHHFVNGSDAEALAKARQSVDLLIATAPVNIDWVPYLRTLRPNGTLCFVGIPSDPIALQIGRLGSNRAIAASDIGGRSTMREMLDFAARHAIIAWTETLPLDSVNDALDRLRRNDVRYRFVLEK